MATQNIQLGNQSEMDDLSKSVNDLSDRMDNINTIINTPKAFSNSAAGHNGIYRGKDLTNVYTIDEICQMVSDGTFEDLYIGDYITVTIPDVSYTVSKTSSDGETTDTTTTDSSQEVDIIFAGFNNLLDATNGYGSHTFYNKNHITCVTKDCFKTTSAMNSSSTTGDGYYDTDMYKTVLPSYTNALQSVLNNHIVNYNVGATYECSTSGYSMAGAGLTGYGIGSCVSQTYLCLLNEVQLYGSIICSSSCDEVYYNNQQLALFQLAPELKIAHLGKGNTVRQWYWLRTISDSGYFAVCSDNGSSSRHIAGGATYVNGGIRPCFVIS